VSSFELEQFVGRRLRALPAPRAPLTLLPRVLAAARAWSQRPWYAREWLTWPLPWQLGSAAVLLLTIVAGFVMVPTLQLLVADTTASFAAAIEFDLPRFAGGLHVSASALRVIWRALVQPFLPYAFGLVVLMSAASATVAIALNRLMFGRALHS
jgi:hypothetical protein